MKILVTETQLKKLVKEQKSFIDYVKNFYNKLTSKEKPKTIKKPVEKKLEDMDFSPENFAKYVKQLGIKHPDIAIAQAMLESGNFGSDLAKYKNNYFGMRIAKQRVTTALNANQTKNLKTSFAAYKNWADSVKDYKLWQDFGNKGQLSREAYFNLLNKIYCPPPNCGTNDYASKVKQKLSDANKLLKIA